MGYDEERSGRRRSRKYHPEKRSENRETVYENEYENQHREPELTLITDSFKTDRSRQNHQNCHSRKKNASPAKGSSAKARKKARKKRTIVIILTEMAILIGLLVFIGYSYLDQKMNMMQRLPWDPNEIKNIDISQEKQEQLEGYWTVAVFGVDSRNSSVGKGNNSDVIILCNLDQASGELRLLSVFRDTYLNVSDKNSYNKINSAYLQGGPEQAVKALNKNLDLNVDDFVTFNWKAVADAINILGGVDVELTKAEFYYMNAFITETVKATGIPSVPLKKAGMNHLDGVQAVAYGRLRLMDTDYARTERQRKIISLAFDKAKKADWATLNNIIQTVFPQIATSIEVKDVIGMGRDIKRLHLGETSGFPAEKRDANMGKKGACVIPYTLETNVIGLHSFLFGDEAYTPTETVKTISRKIMADAGASKEPKPTEQNGNNGTNAQKESEKNPAKESGRETDESGVKEYESRSESETLRHPGEKPESGAYDESGANRETSAHPGETTKPGTSHESDAFRESGSLWESRPYESEENRPSPGKEPSPSKPGTQYPNFNEPGTELETSAHPGESTKPGTNRESDAFREPGSSWESRPYESGENRPGVQTDTGMILPPGTGMTPSGNGNSGSKTDIKHEVDFSGPNGQ